MKRFGFARAWTESGWQSDVVLTVDERSRIAAVHSGVARGSSTDIRWCDGVSLPGMPNVHSHAFQWTFSGRSEYRTARHDSFWTWREQMYRSVRDLTPGHYFESARQLYRMMLQAGYTAVGEFHYVHNQPEGAPYDPVDSMADALIRAAMDVGIRICMLPVLYQRGGFDGRPLEGTQRRFHLTEDQVIELIERLRQRWGGEDRVTLGLALHSLRAVDPERIGPLVEQFDSVIPGGPVHIHVAEQVPEVDDCLRHLGLRPVELLLDSAPVDSRWCLVHATHMTVEETTRLAATGAVAGVCPATEANLGDGIFSAERWKEEGGRWAIGSDSHIAIDPWAELRMLEYGQRLTTRRRAILCDDDRSCGMWLIDRSLHGGHQALGLRVVRSRCHGPASAGDRGEAVPAAGQTVGDSRGTGGSKGGFAAGMPADWIVLNGAHPALADMGADRILDRLVFCQWRENPVRETWVGGTKVSG